MEVFPASVALVIRALVVSARWAGRARPLALEQATPAADANREAALEARVMVLEDMVEQRDAHLLRPRPEASAPALAQAKQPVKPRQIITRYPNHVWSVDRTRVWRWHLWPTWAFVAVDHFSRMVTAVCLLEGPNAGWVVEALEGAFLRHGPPKHIITDQEGVFVSEVSEDLLSQWNVKQRFGAVGKHGSIAVTERAILTLRQEWLRRVPVIRGLDHLGQLLDDFEEYYNHWRGHSTIDGALPSFIHRGDRWQRPDRSEKTRSGNIDRRFFPDARVTAFRLAARCQAGFTGA